MKFLMMMLAIISSQALAAGFDCAKAQTTIEKKICSDEYLSALDKRMSERYLYAKNQVKDSKEITQSQINWLTVRNKCPDMDCLINTYKDRMEQLRLSVTNKVYTYSLNVVANPLALTRDMDNGVCKAFLLVLNSTRYEIIYQDALGTYFNKFEGFSSLPWTRHTNQESFYQDILERKVLYDEKPPDPESRLTAFRKHLSESAGASFYLANATFFAKKNSNRLFPILLTLKNKIVYPDSRRDWYSIFLTDDLKNFWSGEDDKYLKWYSLSGKTLFTYKNSYFALDTFDIDHVYLLPVERYGDPVCSYKLQQ